MQDEPTQNLGQEVSLNQDSLDSNLDLLAKSLSVKPVAPAIPTAIPAPTKVQLNPVATPIPVQIPVGTPVNSASNDVDIISKLLEKKVINDEQFNMVKVESASTGKPGELVAVEKGFVSEEILYKTKSEITGIPFVDLTTVVIPTEVVQKIPFETSKKNNAVLFSISEKKAKVAMLDPLDIQRIKFIGAVIGKEIIPYFTTPTGIKKVLDTKYSAKIDQEVSAALEDVRDTVVIGPTISGEENLAQDLASAPVSRIVNMILEYSIRFSASDIHIEPREDKVAVRYRLNGVLTERLTLPIKLASAIVSRIKILSNLKIDEHRVPQDGRFQVKAGDKSIDLRVSIMPNVYGEKIVMRLLEKGGGVMSLEDTGLRGPSLKVFTDSLTKTQGIILVTGPTGSGKTQTLASSLKILNKPEVNIMTLEDPVEIRINGITQVQINEEVGLTFAKGLRSFLRQDPDIIMVGEIRDKETAELAVQASLTGHLVLATLHTNSAAGALPRLLDMEIEPFLLASTINITAGQRLVRTICPHCKEKYVAPEPVVEKIHQVLQGLKGFDKYSFPKKDNPTAVAGEVSTQDPSKVPTGEVIKQQEVKGSEQVMLFRGRGCNQCNETGYLGRMAIFEVMKFNEKIGKLVMEHRSASNIEQVAIEDGMITMIQDGFMKALEGTTTIEEVLRVVN